MNPVFNVIGKGRIIISELIKRKMAFVTFRYCLPDIKGRNTLILVVDGSYGHTTFKLGPIMDYTAKRLVDFYIEAEDGTAFVPNDINALGNFSIKKENGSWVIFIISDPKQKHVFISALEIKAILKATEKIRKDNKWD